MYPRNRVSRIAVIPIPSCLLYTSRGKEVVEMSEVYTKKESVFMELRASTPPIPTVAPTPEETGTTSASVATGETEGLAEMQTPEYTDSAEVHVSP